MLFKEEMKKALYNIDSYKKHKEEFKQSKNRIIIKKSRYTDEFSISETKKKENDE